MQNEINSFKSTLRTLYKQRRDKLSSAEIKQQSEEININFIKNLLPKLQQKFGDAIFSLYISNGNEVSTNLIAAHFINSNIKFCYPKIIKKNFHLEFILNQQNQLFAKNIFYPKILEPKDGKKVLPNILIMPLLAFDSDLTRLGMGGGFFDRTIEFLKINKKIITVGLAYDFQRSTALLPKTKTDCALDFVVLPHDIVYSKTVAI